MRRALSALFTGALIGGCAGPDIVRPPTGPTQTAILGVSTSRVSVSTKVSPIGILDDAIDRLVPALGSPGVALLAPLRQLRDSGLLDASLVDAAQRQLAALKSLLPPETAPDADALDVALVALRVAASS